MCWRITREESYRTVYQKRFVLNTSGVDAAAMREVLWSKQPQDHVGFIDQRTNGFSWTTVIHFMNWRTSWPYRIYRSQLLSISCRPRSITLLNLQRTPNQMILHHSCQKFPRVSLSKPATRMLQIQWSQVLHLANPQWWSSVKVIITPLLFGEKCWNTSVSIPLCCATVSASAAGRKPEAAAVPPPTRETTQQYQTSNKINLSLTIYGFGTIDRYIIERSGISHFLSRTELLFNMLARYFELVSLLKCSAGVKEYVRAFIFKTDLPCAEVRCVVWQRCSLRL